VSRTRRPLVRNPATDPATLPTPAMRWALQEAQAELAAAEQREAAEYAHCSPKHIRSLTERGLLRRAVAGRIVRVDLNELDALLETGEA
jgi:hypothetical protein